MRELNRIVGRSNNRWLDKQLMERDDAGRRELAQSLLHVPWVTADEKDRLRQALQS